MFVNTPNPASCRFCCKLKDICIEIHRAQRRVCVLTWSAGRNGMVLWSPLWLSHRPWCYVTRSLRCLNAGPHTRPACLPACLCMAFIHQLTNTSSAHDPGKDSRKRKICALKNALHTFWFLLIAWSIFASVSSGWHQRAGERRGGREGGKEGDACTAPDLSNWNKPTMNGCMLAVVWL